MIKHHQNCDATCDAIKHFALFLWLRKKTFYAIMELPRENGKRRYWRQSLYTGNFYQARESLNQMAIEIDKRIKNKIQQRKLLTPFMTRKELIKARDEAIEEYNFEFKEQNSSELLTNKDPSVTQVSNAGVKQYTISEVVEAMLTKANTSKETETKKRHQLSKLFEVLKLSSSDEYSKFHNSVSFSKLNDYILKNDDLSNDNKKRHISLIRELATYGHNLDSDQYKLRFKTSLD